MPHTKTLAICLWTAITFLCIVPQPLLAQRSNSSYVNLLIGTSGDNGQVDPGAAVPFGMVRACPDMVPRSHAGYDHAVQQVSGISVNRLSGVGCSGAGGNLSVKPSLPDFALYLDKNTEHAEPGYYKATFNNGVQTELTATHNIAVERFTFPKNKEAIISIDFGASFERMIDEKHNVPTPNEIQGQLTAANVCGRGSYTLFYHIETKQPFVVKGQTDRQLILSFGTNHRDAVEIRIALSSVSPAAAEQEMQNLSQTGFDKVKYNAVKQWKNKLSKINVRGSADDKTLFYTSLYRTYLSPANVTSSNGQFRGTDGNIHIANGYTYYSSWSLWDTYRTKFPLLTLLEPEAMGNMAKSLVKLYQTGKQNWSTHHEATPTVRTEHAVILLLDAYSKHIGGIDLMACYPQLCKEATELPMNSPDQKLESVCDLWALAKIADIVGKKDDAAKYLDLSERLFEDTWKREFMSIDPSFSLMRNNGLYQGSRWQYRWAVPQYLHKMAQWVGGTDSLLSQLNFFFDNHLYNHGNEPDIHVPYLFNRLNAPYQTQRCVDAIMYREITQKYGGNAELPTPYVGRAYKNAPEGYLPEMDEDDGTMSAWYVFSAIGLYPLVVGLPDYELKAPLFKRVEIKLDNGKRFVVKTNKRPNSDAQVKQIRLNGKLYPKLQLLHNDVLKGGVLEFCF